jgi:hypothetical protein
MCKGKIDPILCLGALHYQITKRIPSALGCGRPPDLLRYRTEHAGQKKIPVKRESHHCQKHIGNCLCWLVLFHWRTTGSNSSNKVEFVLTEVIWHGSMMESTPIQDPNADGAYFRQSRPSDAFPSISCSYLRSPSKPAF